MSHDFDFDFDSDSAADQVGIFYRGNDSDLEQLIIDTFVRLPEDIQEFVCVHCRILSIGRSANGIVLSGKSVLPNPLHMPEGIRWAIEQGRIEELLLNPPKLILLSERIVDEHEPKNVMSIIAHEIAHAFLGHIPLSAPVGDASLAIERETEACELALKWGFSGRGTDVEGRTGYFRDL